MGLFHMRRARHVSSTALGLPASLVSQDILHKRTSWCLAEVMACLQFGTSGTLPTLPLFSPPTRRLLVRWSSTQVNQTTCSPALKAVMSVIGMAPVSGDREHLNLWVTISTLPPLGSALRR